jgi:hypothetical protein
MEKMRILIIDDERNYSRSFMDLIAMMLEQDEDKLVIEEEYIEGDDFEIRYLITEELESVERISNEIYKYTPDLIFLDYCLNNRIVASEVLERSKEYFDVKTGRELLSKSSHVAGFFQKPISTAVLNTILNLKKEIWEMKKSINNA